MFVTGSKTWHERKELFAKLRQPEPLRPENVTAWQIAFELVPLFATSQDLEGTAISLRLLNQIFDYLAVPMEDRLWTSLKVIALRNEMRPEAAAAPGGPQLAPKADGESELPRYEPVRFGPELRGIK